MNEIIIDDDVTSIVSLALAWTKEEKGFSWNISLGHTR